MYNFVKLKPRIVKFGSVNNDLGEPVSCNAALTLILQPGVPTQLFGASHITHDDQIKIVSGSMIGLVIFERVMHYIPLDKNSDLLFIRKHTWHSFVNISEEDVVYFNFLKYDRPQSPKDYQPIPTSHNFSLDYATLAQNSRTIIKSETVYPYKKV